MVNILFMHIIRILVLYIDIVKQLCYIFIASSYACQITIFIYCAFRTMICIYAILIDISFMSVGYCLDQVAFQVPVSIC